MSTNYYIYYCINNLGGTVDFVDYSFVFECVSGLPPIVQGLMAVMVPVVVMYSRTKSSNKRTQDSIDKAMMIKDINDKADSAEASELHQRIRDLLNIQKDRLYTSMVSFVYDHEDGEFRYIDIIRANSKNPKPAKEYLTEHHSESKNVIFDKVLPYITKQLALHKVAENITQETNIADNTVQEIRGMLLNGIHKVAGCNKETKDVEDSAVTFLSLMDMYNEISKECVLLREKRNQDVQKALQAVK